MCENKVVSLNAKSVHRVGGWMGGGWKLMQCYGLLTTIIKSNNNWSQKDILNIFDKKYILLRTSQNTWQGCTI
jgi:hypothetical protein